MVQILNQPEVFNAEFSELINRLISFYDPDQLYVFGSRARGDFHEDSDYDIMVVVPDTTSDESISHCEEVKSGLHINADVKVFRRSSFDKHLHLKASMPSTILREGKLLYSRAGAPNPERLYFRTSAEKIGRVCEEDLDADDPVRRNTMFHWIQCAHLDLRGGEWFLSDNSEAGCGLSLFHSQQAVEKALKAFLAWQDFPAKKHHDLKELASDCCQVDGLLESSLTSIEWLTKWSVAGRYYVENTPQATIELANQGLATARRVYQAIIQRLPQEVVAKLKPLV